MRIRILNKSFGVKEFYVVKTNHKNEDRLFYCCSMIGNHIIQYSPEQIRPFKSIDQIVNQKS
jgi:hypothetical protein